MIVCPRVFLYMPHIYPDHPTPVQERFIEARAVEGARRTVEEARRAVEEARRAVEAARRSVARRHHRRQLK